jgi:predicted ATPase
MLRMFVDDGLLQKSGTRWIPASDLSEVEMPPTIQALLAARLDRLTPEEQEVIQRAAVMGKAFWWGAVSELAADRVAGGVGAQLQSLLRKELIRPDRSSFAGEDAFRFSHILIRDAAYRGMPKELRSDLHQRFARWLERKAGDRSREYEEIIGYHLERAFYYRHELGALDETAQALAREAATRLASAGERTFMLSDMSATANLLKRAVSLLPTDDPRRSDLLLTLCAALIETCDFDEADRVVEQVLSPAKARADRHLESSAIIRRLFLRLYTNDLEGWKDEALDEAGKAISVFEEADDEHGLALANQLLAEAYWVDSQYGRAEEMLQRALQHAERAGDDKEQAKIVGWLPSVLVWGPTHAKRGWELCEDILQRARVNPMAEAKCLLAIAALQAMLGRFEEARASSARGKSMLSDLGLTLAMAGSTQISGMIEMLADNPADAEAEFRSGYEILNRLGDNGYLPVSAAFLAKALYAQTRYEEADKLSCIAEEMSAGDEASKPDWATTRAKLLARQGRMDEAEALASEAVAIAARTDELKDHADALMDMAEVMALGDRHEEAAQHIEAALDLYQRKGVAPAVDHAGRLLKHLRSASTVTPRS